MSFGAAQIQTLKLPGFTETLYWCPCQGGYVTSSKVCECAQPAPDIERAPAPLTSTPPPIIPLPVTARPTPLPAPPLPQTNWLPWIIAGVVLLTLTKK